MRNIFKSNTDAELFLHFIRMLRENPDIERSTTAGGEIPYEEVGGKFGCIYCGCTYVYKKSLIGHMKRLHNIQTEYYKKAQ